MYKFFIVLALCFSSILFSCEGEDWVNNQNKIHYEAMKQNLIFADNFLVAKNYKMAHEYYLAALEEFSMLTFHDMKDEIRIHIGILETERFLLR